MYNWETVGRTMLIFFNLYTLNKETKHLLKLNTSQPPTIRTLSSGITRFDQKPY